MNLINYKPDEVTSAGECQSSGLVDLGFIGFRV